MMMKASVSPYRFKLVLLWIAVVMRALGENSVRAYVVMRNSNPEREYTFGFLFLLLGLAAAPLLALAPLIGAVASSRARWPIMMAATAAGLGAIAWSSYQDDPLQNSQWLGCLAILAFESAFFYACLFVLVPEVARKASVSLPQLNGIFAVGTCAGLLVGFWIGIEQFLQGRPGMPVPLQLGHVGYGLALLCLLFTRFDPEATMRVNDGLVRPFLKTAREVFRDRYGRNSLLLLWALFTVGLAVTQWLMPIEAQYTSLIALLIGLVAGGLHAHPFRSIGLVPVGMLGLSICAIWGVAAGNWQSSAAGITGFVGLTFVPLLTCYQIHQPTPTRGHGAALLQAGAASLTGGFLVVLLLFLPNPDASKPLVAGGVLVVCLSATVFAWLVFFRPIVELASEIIISPLYRISAVGPGLQALPWKGPLLIIGNHTAWFDPLWLAKIVPLPITPMMTSRFYDLPIISWLMRKVVGAIRVPNVVMRKDAPEIEQAIAALDRGDCVVIFPEGWLRRKELQELRRFGRGIWQILKARPDLPVFACWIDGGWGSMVSHKGGPPIKNKPLDFRRRIRIAVSEPIKIDPTMLDNHMATRTHLMNVVLAARGFLGLPPIEPFTLQSDDAADDKASEHENEDAS